MVGTDLFFPASIASFDLVLKELVEGCYRLVVVVCRHQRDVEVVAKLSLVALVVYEIFYRVREICRCRSKAEIFSSILQA